MLQEAAANVVPYKSSQYVVSRFRRLAGKTLTVIDASIHDPRANKAIKDLLRAAFSDEIANVREFFGDKAAECVGSLEQIAEAM